MAGIPRFQKGERGAVADLAHDDPVRAEAHGRLQEHVHAHRVGRAQEHPVLGRSLDLGRVLDDDEAMFRREALHLANESIGQRRLSGAGAAHDQDVFAVVDRLARGSRPGRPS